MGSSVPGWNPDFHGQVILGQRDRWFDPKAFKLPSKAFKLPSVGTFGNVSRGPGLVNVDTSIFKNINLTERLQKAVPGGVFNILNKANYAYPNTIIFTGNANSYSTVDTAGATIFTSGTSRQLQFALKLLF